MGGEIVPGFIDNQQLVGGDQGPTQFLSKHRNATQHMYGSAGWAHEHKALKWRGTTDNETPAEMEIRGWHVSRYRSMENTYDVGIISGGSRNADRRGINELWMAAPTCFINDGIRAPQVTRPNGYTLMGRAADAPGDNWPGIQSDDTGQFAPNTLVYPEITQKMPDPPAMNTRSKKRFVK